jgi:hypothetical protein
MKMSRLLIALFVLLVLALIVIAIVAGTMRKPPYPVQPPVPPKVVGWENTTTEAAWPYESYYRYAYLDIVHNLVGPWSVSSAAVFSDGSSSPILEIVPTGTTLVTWQRRTPAVSGNWTDVPMLALQTPSASDTTSNMSVPLAPGKTAKASTSSSSSSASSRSPMLTLTTSSLISHVAPSIQAQTHSAFFVDLFNPAGVPSQPASSPIPSQSGAKYVERGFTWNVKVDKSLNASQRPCNEGLRFACRFVGSEPSAWGPWSSGLWRSDSYAQPVLQFPERPQGAVVQYTGSWLDVTEANHDVTFNVSNQRGIQSFVHGSLTLGSSTVDGVLRSIKSLVQRQQPGLDLWLEFCPETSLVSLSFLDEHVGTCTEFSLLVNSQSVFRSLGFNCDILRGRAGVKYTAGSVPNIAFRPTPVTQNVMVVSADPC